MVIAWGWFAAVSWENHRLLNVSFCSTFDTASGPGIHILGLPFGKLSHNNGKSQFLMGNSTINGQCQKQTVSLPEANSPKVMPLSPALHGPSWESCELSPGRGFADGLEQQKTTAFSWSLAFWQRWQQHRNHFPCRSSNRHQKRVSSSSFLLVQSGNFETT